MRKISAVFLAALFCICCFAGVSTATEMIQNGDFSDGLNGWSVATTPGSSQFTSTDYVYVTAEGGGAHFEMSGTTPTYGTEYTYIAYLNQYNVDLTNVNYLTFKTKKGSMYGFNPGVVLYVWGGPDQQSLLGSYTFNNLGSDSSWTTQTIDVSAYAATEGIVKLTFSSKMTFAAVGTPATLDFYITDVSAIESAPTPGPSELLNQVIQVGSSASLNYTFTGYPSGSTYINWGDSSTYSSYSGYSGIQSHKYNSEGTYTITYYAQNNVGKSVDQTVTVEVVNLDFDVYGASSGNAPFDAAFTLTASNLQSILWDFGDGQTSSSTVNPTSHRYTGSGIYTVNLTGYTALGRSLTISKPDLINTQSQSVSFNASTYEVGSVATISWTLRDPVFSSHSYNLYVYPATADGSISSQNPVLTFEILNSTTTSTTWFTKGLTGGYYSAYIFEDTTSLAHTSPAVTLLSYVTLTVNLAISGATYYNTTTVDLIQNGATVYTNTTTEGFVKFENIASGTYQVQATTTGYATQSATVLLTQSSSITIDFVTGTTDDTSSGMGSQYAASYVTFRCYDSGTGKPLSGVTVNVVGVEPTNPIEWMANLFGNAWGSKMIGTNLTGTSDDNGVVTFAMVPNVRYQVTIIYGTYKDEKVFQPSTLTGEYPLELEITKWDTTNKFDRVVTSVTPTDDKQIIANYTDNTQTTQALNISLYEVTDGERVYVSSQTATANSFIATFTPTSPSGRSYIVTINSTTTSLGKITREYSVDFNGPRIVIGSLPDNFYIILSFLILAMVGGVGSVITSRMYCLVVVVVAAFLWYAGWLFALGTVGSFVLLLCFVLALIYYIASKSGGGD